MQQKDQLAPFLYKAAPFRSAPVRFGPIRCSYEPIVDCLASVGGFQGVIKLAVSINLSVDES